MVFLGFSRKSRRLPALQIHQNHHVCVCVFFYYTPSAQASGVPCLLQTVGHDVCLAHSKTLSKTSSEVPEGEKERERETL